MPFILPERRKVIDEFGTGGKKAMAKLEYIQPGDICYKYYKRMVDAWKANPRWSTAHELYRILLEEEKPSVLQTEFGPHEFGDWDVYAAMWLAWQVFFQLYVIPYELRKREENGDI